MHMSHFEFSRGLQGESRPKYGLQCLTFNVCLTKKTTIFVGGVAQLVVASPLMLKGIGFDPG